MFNLHIGTPGIIPNMVHSVEQANLLEGCSDVQILSQKTWQEQFRGLVNRDQNKASFSATDWRAVEEKVVDLSNQGPVALSQHALMGRIEDCFIKRKMLPYADKRLGRLTEIFANVPVTLHLTIQNQFDYLQAAVNRLPEGKSFPEPRVVPSWSELVRRIKAAAPGTKVVVWEFDKPEEVALSFLMYLLNIENDGLINAMRRHLRATLKRQDTTLNGDEFPGPFHELTNRMDLQYELDLLALGRMKGVSLIPIGSIPKELHL